MEVSKETGAGRKLRVRLGPVFSQAVDPKHSMQMSLRTLLLNQTMDTYSWFQSV